MQTYIKELAAKIGETVVLKGWANHKRSSGSIQFLELRDGSGFVQVIVNKSEVDENSWIEAEKLTQESSFEVQGLIAKHPKKENVFEIQAQKVSVIHVSEEYPIGNKEHGPDFLLNERHLWLRSKKQWAILRIRDTVEAAINEYLHSEKFIRVDAPIFTPNACEGTTTLFPVPYFDLGEAYLSQSGQLYIEAAIASVGRCYDFGPVFRAEKSVTKRHLTEFWMMDAEAAFVEHDENLAIQEGMVKAIVKKCLNECKEELEILERDTQKLQSIVDKPFVRMAYDEAIPYLQERGSDIKYGEDLGNDDEVILTRDSEVPIFIEKWPAAIKSFYMKPDPANPKNVLNADLIATEGAGEIIGGSEREADYDKLLAKIKEEGYNLDEYNWYLDLRKYGSVPHSGFGIGVERMVRWVSGVEHVRECIPFPRLVNRLRP